MAIFDFLLRNWFILIVLYVLFNSLVKRFRPPGNAGGQRARPSKGMPPFGGESGWPGRGAEAQQPTVTKAAPAKSKPSPAAAPARQAPANAGAAGAVRTASPSPAAADAPRDVRAQSRRPLLPEPPASDAVEAPAAIGPLTAQDVARGVIWAEILGPPRAKRPYRR